MSGTQSTLTDRTPNILNKEPVDRKPKNDKCSVSLKHEFDPTGLVQRCVIIQRDENGFGLTVSGDNPVFVQLVKEDGAAMRAGVQTGDRIIKVNGTLVTHSNHIEVVKLIKSGSYVALTVLGRPPGLPQLPLEEEDEEGDEEEERGGGERRGHEEEEQDEEGEREEDDGGEVGPPAPREGSPAPTPQRENKAAHSHKLLTLQKMLMKEQQELQAKEEELSRNPRPKLLKELQEAKRQVALLQEQLAKAASSQDDEAKGDDGGEAFWNNNSCSSNTCGGGGVGGVLDSPDTSRRLGPQSCSSPDTEDATDADCSAQGIVGSPPYLLNLQIIGAEDDYFDSQQEQISGQCSCFQSIDLLKCRPAHLAVFLHHVVSQFDPTPLLCFLYADMHKQSSSKESRRFFMEFHSLFIDRTANLKVPVPDTITAELDKRRLELMPEELCKQLTQQLQEALLPDLHRNLDDFRHKRSMGLTLAEDELSKLESEGGKDPQALEKECSCAEHILSKIEDILLTSQPTEEEKCQTMQYVILTYMKHLGVKVKEPRGLEHKRPRINFLPKIKKSIKPEKEGEEKVKKPRFPNILGPPRRLTRVDSTSVGKAVELNKQRSPRQPSQSAQSISELPDPSSAGAGRPRGSQLSEGSDSGATVSPFTASPTHSSPSGPASDTSGQESDSNLSPFPPQLRLGEPQPAGEQQDAVCSPTLTHFDFSPSNLEQLQEEEQDPFRMEVQCAAGSAELQSEQDRGGEGECEEALPNWQSLVSREVLASMTPGDINRQEVINELFYTERAHLRTLKVLDRVFYQRLNRDAVLPPEDVRSIFTNLEEIIQLHVALMEQMTAIRKRSETSVIGQIGDDLLAWFSGEEEEKIIGAVGTFCSNQPSALELIKTRKKKDQRFTLFMQEAESNRLCRRLQLKDIIPMEMMRVTKYPLLLENIAKYTEDREERDKVKRAGECCKKILNHVNQAVKEAENKQRLVEYQRRLDISSLKQSENPVILELKNLDLTKRTMVHEGILSWKVSKDKTIELYAVLLEDILVLLQKQDERLVLKFHGKSPANALDVKNILSPVIKLNTVLVRPVATDNKSFFVLSMSDNGAQIYELMAQKVSDQRTWQCLITQCAEAMKAKPHGSVSPAVASQAERDAIEIISREMPKAGKDASGSPSANADAAEIPPPPVSLNPFDGMKSDEEEEEEVSARGQQQEGEEQEGEALEEEVDEAELEAFLDGQLADRLLQEGSRRGVAIGNQELDAFDSKAEDALRTLVMLKKVLFSHMISKEEDERKEEMEETEPSGGGAWGGGGATDSPDGPPPASSDNQTQKADAQEAPPEPPGCNGGFVVLDGGGGGGGGFDESSTDDDGGGSCDVGIDMSKLLSSSSQAEGGGGPALSRQLMTHLRLLQADLQYLKEVETKYNELRQTLGDTPTDSDDNNDGVQ